MRLHYLDAMRSTLMLLGVFLHAAAIYAYSAEWIISDPAKSNLLSRVWIIIAQFRMPCFFIISGFFCYLTLHRSGIRRFLKTRMRRIVIPLIAVAITFNSAQYYMVQKFYISPLFDFSLSQYLVDGYWVGHLWFLNCLIIYFLMSALGYYLLRKPAEKIFKSQTFPFMQKGTYLLVLPLGTLGLTFLSYRVEDILNSAEFFIDINEVFHYSEFFFFGYLMSVRQKLFEDFSEFHPWVVVATVGAIYGRIHFGEEADIFAKMLNRYFDAFVPWGCAALCFCIFKKFFHKTSKIFSYFADASYSIYLFHHFFVVIVGLALMSSTVHVYVKYAITVSLALSLSILIHHFLVLRFNVLSWLFNGKSLKEQRSAPVKVITQIVIPEGPRLTQEVKKPMEV